MAASKGTTNIAVDRTIKDRMQAVSDKNGVKLLELTNALLDDALKRGEVSVFKKEINIDFNVGPVSPTKPVPRKKPHKKAT